MARKDIFSSVMNPAPARAERNEALSYVVSGASRSIKSSFEELAKGSVVELDPEIIDGSFVTDRIDDDDEAFQELLAAVKERGQDSPILVRPHPSAPGRYQVVFGHRRVKVARVLGRQVRAVVKPMADQDHVIAQGQENAARSNLSFIERTLFAKRLADLGYDQTVIKSALALDATTFSKMQSVASHVPEAVILAIGSAKATGRDRWWQLSKLMQVPGNAEKALAFVMSNDFAAETGDARFSQVSDFLAKSKRAVSSGAAASKTWAAKDKSVNAAIKDSGKAFTLALKAKNASRFGAYITDHLDELYRAFQEIQSSKPGD
ncbi:plasmid partitioning protein RepB [Phyllobacterium endophyticum]|uniref:plasmid partitioning protein RepB n=1 Tax=Phyllobacterium endophyticum TaxID=1149773 RepID=UPI0011CBFDAE|nr:plasmid partitioning protein RepB [Phyllobacterium endophyticum]TXR48891.1 plasmid partitioning protein RepB [Phyllobacterium endophyticum]